MINTNSNAIQSEEARPHIKAYCLMMNLQSKLFNTNIRVNACDGKKSKTSIVLIGYKNQAEEALVDKAIEEVKDRGIAIVKYLIGEPVIGYLDGDF